jgi:hypothetical protein
MGKVMLVIFATLTFGSVYMTVKDVGVMEPTLRKSDVRQGSARTHVFVGGGHRVK